MDKIPILLYHSLCSATDKNADNLSVTFENFKEQMDYLHQNGFLGISLEKLIAEIEYWKNEDLKSENKSKDTRKKVALTFDDGDLSNYYYAFPTLKELGFTATFFVTINEIGKEKKMDWPMIYELSKNGMDIGSHGMAHTFLTAHNNYTIFNELLMSKQILEKYTRRRIDFLSIPRGFYNRRILIIAKDVGFKAACVSDAGFNDFTSENIFLLKRFPVRKNYSLKTVRSIICARPSLSLVISENMRTTFRRLLGWQIYDRLRRLKYRDRKRGE